MKLADLIEAMEAVAPTRYAETWDNVGLLVGDAKQDITRAMLCIDYTPEVACEAAGEKCDLIIAYHPPIFSPLKRIVAGNVIFDAVQRGVAIYSPHTAWDVAEGGTNDLLADAIGISADSRRPLRLIESKDSQYKLITFVPKENVEAVSDALFAAGAGHIGDYSRCSFQSSGAGTFLGAEGKTNPTVGRSGKLEHADEIRLETVAPIAKLEIILAALRLAHPYEEPAFDLVKLATPPENLGQGRIGDIASVERSEVFARIRKALSIDRLLVAGPTEGAITRAAVCAGSCGEMLDDAIALGAQLFLTGEMRHHDALKAAGRNVTVVCTLHSNSERASLARLRDRIAEKVPGLVMVLSRKDRDPFVIA